MRSRSVFCGTRRRLVLAFDVGMANSGISYSLLDPGQVPEIKKIMRFPGRGHINSAFKIPTIIYYDRAGKVCAVGEDIDEIAEEENWVKAEWLTLHPGYKVDAPPYVTIEIPPLPLNKSVVEVFADFLRYLLECASSYIQDTHANGLDLWISVKDQIDFILSHPNGWEGKSEMRRAAVLAELIPDTTHGHARLSFVTEGVASLHFSIQSGLFTGAMKDGDGVTIVDAGAMTIDVSSYSRDTKAAKETFVEVAAPECHLYGSSFVSIEAGFFLQNFLADSSFIGDLEHITRCFDETTKLRFRKAEEPQYIKFGSTRDNDETYNILVGQLKLMGTDVASFFEPSVNCIVKAVLDQRKSAHNTISHVVLVGGFATSDWLFNRVHEALTPLGLTILRLESHTKRAVSDGAIYFYLDHFLPIRVSNVSQPNCKVPDTPPSAITTTTTTEQPSSTNHHDVRPGCSSQPISELNPDALTSYVEPSAFNEGERPIFPKGPTSTMGSKTPCIVVSATSRPTSYGQIALSSEDPQDPPPGVAGGTVPGGGSHASQASTGRPPNAQVLPGDLPEDEQRETSEGGPSAQGSNHGQGMMGDSSFIPAAGSPSLKDKYQLMHWKNELRRVLYMLDGYKQELRKTRGELGNALNCINELRLEKRRWRDDMTSLQNELNTVHQQLKDAKNLSEAGGKEPLGAQVFVTKADALSISEVGEKVTALNKEIFQAAATLGEGLVYRHRDLSQEHLDAAVAESQESVGEKISSILISQAQKPGPEVNPLLVLAVLQIFMVKFCVSKIQSWFPSDSNIGGFPNGICSKICMTEEQSVSGRWRALTRAHTRPNTETWTQELFQKLMSIFKIASWTSGSPESIESFIRHLPPIFKAANELRIGEFFTSADLDISVFDCGRTYDPSYMEDAYPIGIRAPEIVAGTTGIGLKKVMAERGANDTLQFQNVISAKIVLESTLREALEHAQTSGGLRKQKPAGNTDDGDKNSLTIQYDDPPYMKDAYGHDRQPIGKRAPEIVAGTTGIALKTETVLAERGTKHTRKFQNVISVKLSRVLESVQTSSNMFRRKKKPDEKF